MMSVFFCALVFLSVLFALWSGKLDILSAEMFAGASGAVELCLSIAGVLCLWSGLMRVLEKSGVTRALAKIASPLFRRLYPHSHRDPAALEAITGNFAANFLGIGNAATPFGIRAADRIAAGTLGPGRTRELATLIVMNTASVQLLPTTICAVRAMNGARSAFDILPAVWLSSLASVAAGLVLVRLLCRPEKHGL